MQGQGSREDRVRAVTRVIALQVTDRKTSPDGRVAHDVARALAEQVVDAVTAVDERAERSRSSNA